jgi:putative lipid kinase SP_1045
MKKALLIINPTSGGEKALDYREKLEDKAGQYFDHVETKITQKAKDATEFAKQASEEGYEAVFAFGGDGTVNEVISGLAENEHIPRLAIIPGGTGNLITKLLGISQDIDRAIEELDFDSTNRIDIGKCNDNFFGYIFSIGSIPQAIHNVDIEEKTKFGFMAYAYRSVKSAIKDETFKVHIKTEKTEYKGDASHVIVLLSNFIGDKKMFDHNRVGYANILILKEASLASKVGLIPDFLKGALVENDKIEFFEAKEISITSDRPLETDIDGDEGDRLPVDIKVLADHIEVYSPQNQ